MTYQQYKYYPVTYKNEGFFFKMGASCGRYCSYPWMGLYKQKEGKFLFWNYTYHKLLLKEDIDNLINQDEVKSLKSQSPSDPSPAVRLCLLRLLERYGKVPEKLTF